MSNPYREPSVHDRETPPAPPPLFVEGVDVSGYQPSIEYSIVAASGRRFMYVKASERLTPEVAFPKQWAGAKGAGLLRGAYHFLRANSNGAAQARLFMDRLKGDAGELPPWCDVETADGMTLPGVLTTLQLWIATVTPVLGRPIVYVSPSFWASLRFSNGGLADTITESADLAVAAYGPAHAPAVPAWRAARFWQYSGTGKCPGVAGACDLDRWLGPMSALSVYSDAWRATVRL